MEDFNPHDANTNEEGGIEKKGGKEEDEDE